MSDVWEQSFEKVDLAEHLREFRLSDELRAKLPGAAAQEDAYYAKLEAELRAQEQPGDWYARWAIRSTTRAFSGCGGIALMRGDKPVFMKEQWIS